MSFDVSASAYSRFMGQYSEPLAALFADWCSIEHGQRALDVGCGTGALTAQLAARLGERAVAAIDPSASFVTALRDRLPDVRAAIASAEDLPFADNEFDVALAQLVVHFMTDPVAGLREMGRVTRPGGIVAACVWDYSGQTGPVSVFWAAARELDPSARGESGLAGTTEGHLADLFDEAGLQNVRSSSLTVTRRFESFDDWWRPYTLGVGPAGQYVATLSKADRNALRARCARLLPVAPFETTAKAWCARGESA